MRGAPLWFRAVETWTGRRRRSDFQRIHSEATTSRHAILLYGVHNHCPHKLAFRRSSVKPKRRIAKRKFFYYFTSHDSETIRSLARSYGHVAD